MARDEGQTRPTTREELRGDEGEARRRSASEARPTLEPDREGSKPTTPGSPVVEMHVCMGLNACQGHGVGGSGPMAGMGECATVQHVCHGDNACRGQGGCGYAGSDLEQAEPGNQSCSQNGSCASPVNVSRTSSAGPNKGKSVWKLARQIFEERMYAAGVPFGPSPGEGYPDDLVPPYEQPYSDPPPSKKS